MKKNFFQIFLPTSSKTKTDKANLEIHIGIIYLCEKLCQWSCSCSGFSFEWILQVHARRLGRASPQPDLQDTSQFHTASLPGSRAYVFIIWEILSLKSSPDPSITPPTYFLGLELTWPVVLVQSPNPNYSHHRPTSQCCCHGLRLLRVITNWTNRIMSEFWRVEDYVTPKCAILLYWLFWAVRRLKTSKFRERLSLTSPYVPKDKSSQKNLMVISPLPGSFINQERLILITREATGSQHHTQRNFVINIIPTSILLRPLHLS